MLYKHKKQQAVLLYDHLPVTCSDIIFCISSILQTGIRLSVKHTGLLKVVSLVIQPILLRQYQSNHPYYC